MKRVLAATLCFVLLMAGLSFGVNGSAEEEALTLVQTIEKEAKSSYYRSRSTAGRSSFHGVCGLMVSHQLYNLDINKHCIVFNGNDHYDYYASREVTSGGYYINPYPADGYSLQEALMAVSNNGTRDVRNILVGFQWTKTEAGRKYGHVVFINGIVDGTVYFVESFDCPLGGPEGTINRCSIASFAKYYDSWTQFDGLIHFGSGSYRDVCPNTPTDVTVQARFDTILRSEPALVGKKGCVRLRSVAVGERLRATAIYEADRYLYYQVETNDGFAFVPVSAVSVLQANTQGLTLSGLILPKRIKPGEVPAFSGTVVDLCGNLSSVEVCITDDRDRLIRRELAEVQEPYVQLHTLRSELLFDLLEAGRYQVDIYASRACPAISGGYTTSYDTRVLLSSRSLQVGGNPQDALQTTSSLRSPRDGWLLEKGVWYCYSDGKPCTGWVTYMGVRYYLQADGSVTTGAQNVDGQQLYFSATGALVTGWLTLEGNTTYRTEDGTAVSGWQQIENNLYCFGEDGILLTNTTHTKDGISYVIADDGIATIKPTENQEA